MSVKQQQCRYGPMMYLDNDKYMGHSLDKYGESHYYQVEYLKQLLADGDTVIDVGANIGTITVPLAKRVGPTGKVVAYEPQRFIYHMLCGNLALNHCENVQTENKAVGGRGNFLPRDIPYHECFNFGGIATLDSLEGDVELVQTEYIDDLGLKPKLIKIDVEGKEEAVIYSGFHTICNNKPYLYVDYKNNLRGLLKTLDRIEYDWKIHEPAAYNPWSYRGHLLNEDDDDILMGMVSTNIICYPRGQSLPLKDNFIIEEPVLPRHKEIHTLWQQIKN